MKINEFETQKLKELYELANTRDWPSDWEDIRQYYNELGRKYKFNPRQVMINTKGVVTRKGYQTIWIVYNTKDDVVEAAYYDKMKALRHTTEDENCKCSEVGLF